MITVDKEEKISSLIQAVTGKKSNIKKDKYHYFEKENRIFKIKKILIFYLTSSDVLLKPDSRLLRCIHEGRPNTAMDAWQSAMSEEAIRDVLAYVLTFSAMMGADEGG